MSRVTVLQNEHAIVYFHAEKKIVHTVLKPTISGDNLKQILNTGTEMLTVHGAVKWLSDSSAIHGHTEEDAEWINSQWLPATVEAGLQYWVLIVPEDSEAALKMQTFFRAFSEMGVRTMVSVDAVGAMEWLENVDEA